MKAKPLPADTVRGPASSLTRLIFNSGGRRFLLTVGTQVSVTVLVWAGKIDPAAFRDIIIGIVGIYIAGNTFQKVKAGSSTE